MTEAKNQVEELVSAVVAFADSDGVRVVEAFQKECKPLLLWLGFLNSYCRTGTADTLLDGAACALREAAACASIGMVRPAIFSLRTHIDLILGWLYFKDHPIEWAGVNKTGDGFKMKAQLLDYYADSYVGYKGRMAALKEVASRSQDEPYRLLSAHIHAQSNVVLPKAGNLKDVIQGAVITNEFTRLAGEVAEYLNDVLCAVHGKQWAAIPVPLRTAIDARLASKKHTTANFYAGL